MANPIIKIKRGNENRLYSNEFNITENNGDKYLQPLEDGELAYNAWNNGLYIGYNGTNYLLSVANENNKNFEPQTFYGTATNALIASSLGGKTVGSSSKPIYLSAGSPIECGDSLDVDIDGNAATATKWQTARNFSISGTASDTTTYSVDGTKNITLTLPKILSGFTSLSAATFTGGVWNGTTVAIDYGGTGLTSNPSMLVNLGSTTADTVFKTSPRPGVTGTLPVANGGTGATTLTSGAALIGNGTGAISTRSITNNTTAGSSITASTNLITANTLANWNGAYDGNGNSRITKLGTVSKGVWNGTTVAVAYGGTGNTAQTKNRLIYSEEANKLSSSGHYANSTKVAINSTTAPTETLYINGTLKATGNTSIGGTLGVTGATTLSSTLGVTGTTTLTGVVYLKGGASYTATIKGPTANGEFLFPGTGGTFVTHATRGTAVGGTSKPVYIASTGRATALTATKGGTTQPVYLKAGAIEPITATAVAYGGTGATNAIDARVNLLGLADNIINTLANDTVANWGVYGPCATTFISKTGQITDQPSQWGFIMNITNQKSSEIHQIWATQPHGDMYHRGGNASGWNGTWRKLVDSINMTELFTAMSWSNGTTTGPTLSVTIGGTNKTAQIPSASSSASGIVTTGAQTFAGQKTFSTGITMSAAKQIQRAGGSTSWYLGRSAALIKTTSYSGYDAIASMKTTNGDWSLGVYTNNIFYFTYVTDTNFNAGTNTTTAQMCFYPNGTFHSPVLATGNTGTANPSGTPIVGTLYFKQI